MHAPIQLGSRVYLRNAIAGDPGCVMEFDRRGRAGVEWPDLIEVGRTFHRLETLVLDEGFHVEQLGLEFDQAAA